MSFWLKWLLRLKRIKALFVHGTNSCRSAGLTVSLNILSWVKVLWKGQASSQLFFSHSPAYTPQPLQTSSHPLHTSPSSTRKSSTCGGRSAVAAVTWLLFRKDCPEHSNQRQLVWGKNNNSTSLSVPLNISERSFPWFMSLSCPYWLLLPLTDLHPLTC